MQQNEETLPSDNMWAVDLPAWPPWPRPRQGGPSAHSMLTRAQLGPPWYRKLKNVTEQLRTCRCERTFHVYMAQRQAAVAEMDRYHAAEDEAWFKRLRGIELARERRAHQAANNSNK